MPPMLNLWNPQVPIIPQFVGISPYSPDAHLCCLVAAGASASSVLSDVHSQGGEAHMGVFTCSAPYIVDY